MEALESELTCPMCLDLFEDPVLLPCLHNLCRKCISDLDSYNKKAGGTGGGAEGRSAVRKKGPARRQPDGKAKLTCPTCRTDVPLDERGVDGPSRNMVLQNIVDRFRAAKKDESKPKTAPPCQMCEADPRPAVKVCINCDSMAYCETCLTTFHPARGQLARHTLVLPGQQPSKAAPKVVMCAEHPDEKVNLYCKVDEIPVCALCKLVGKHQGHEVAALSDAYKEKKDLLVKEVSGLKDRNKEIRQFVAGMHKTCVQVKAQNKKWQNKLVQEIKRLEQILGEKKTALAKALSEEEGEKLKLLTDEINKKEEHLQKARAVVAYVEEVLKEKDQSCFLQAVKSTRERVEKNHTKEDLVVPADWLFKGFDVSREAKALKAIDQNELTTCWQECMQSLLASSYLQEYIPHQNYQYYGHRQQQQLVQYDVNKLIDNVYNTYWHSNSHETKHWVRLQLKPGVQARTLSLAFVPQALAIGKWTENHKPDKVTFMAGDDYDDMVTMETVNISEKQREVTLNVDTDKLTFEMKVPSNCIVSKLTIVASKPKA